MVNKHPASRTTHTHIPRRSASELADEYWAREQFGIALANYRLPGMHVVPQAGALQGYEGVFLLKRPATCIASCPASLLARLQHASRDATQSDLFDATRLAGLFPEPHTIVGPAWTGYLVRDDLIPAMPTSQSLLHGEQLNARLDSLRRACDAEEWEYGGLSEQSVFLVGREVDGEMVAVAGYERWGKHLAHIGVITHPAHRGRGLARAVVAEAMRHALSAQLVPQYRSLCTNAASLRIAESLGFTKYAESIAVRLSIATDSGNPPPA